MARAKIRSLARPLRVVAKEARVTAQCGIGTCAMRALAFVGLLAVAHIQVALCARLEPRHRLSAPPWWLCRRFRQARRMEVQY